MGQALIRSIAERDDLQLGGIWVRDAQQLSNLDLDPATRVSTDIREVAASADVLIDFSLPEATAEVVAAVGDAGIPLVTGVSGLDDAGLQLIATVAQSVAVVYDRNMSMGVAVLESLVRQAAASLGEDFAVEVQETHHVHKLDSPSGTALKLGEAIAAARGTDASDIRYKVERRGEVPGDHSVTFSSATEVLTFGHSVTTRQVFADGALRAARWALLQPPGQYAMRDVLGKKIADSL
jgi:4-hydroxy-tetrahydrodipicolinate reductase